jgi:SH3-like domain-containing protein
MALSRFVVLLGFVLILYACAPSQRHDPVQGYAFVGPADLILRKEISLKSPAVETVHFGQKVSIIGTRRSFVRVRTSSGAEGWTNERMLLAQSDIDQIKAQTEAARTYPSQGIATTFDALNVHAQPSLQSPSYAQIKEGEKFDVIEHRLVKTPPATARKQLLPAAPKPAAKKPVKENKSKIPPPPTPNPPALPKNWLELSKDAVEADSAKAPEAPEPPPVAPEDDWTLVRTASGQSGWVLTRRVSMAIPDEVAQYAEGRRITSYFSLGKVRDGDVVKDVWFWTTMESAKHPYDFDGFRVFIWSLRRHRYETALIQRHVLGFFPTMLDSNSASVSVCIQKDDGHRYRRTYQLTQNIMRFVGEGPCEQAQTPVAVVSPENAVVLPLEPGGKQGTLEKLKGKLKSMLKK